MFGGNGSGGLRARWYRHQKSCRQILQGGPLLGWQRAFDSDVLEGMRGRLLMLSGPDQAMQVEDGIGERAIGPQGVLDDHCRLFEHLLGG